MSNHVDIVVIGGGPAGIVSAMTSKKLNPLKKVVLIRKEQEVLIPCGIPYIFNTLKSIEDNVVPDSHLLDNDIEIVIDELINIDTKKKVLTLNSSEEIIYDKLILATGSSPIKIPIKGISCKGVWFVKKDKLYLEQLKSNINKSKKIIILGGGFIGVEFADELISNGKEVILVEKEKHCLSKVFDENLCEEAELKLKEKGCEVYTSSTVDEIIGDDEGLKGIKVNGKIIEGDLVIVSIGVKPNTDFLVGSEVELNDRGFIKTNEYMQTSCTDIYSVGDCTESRCFFTQSPVPILLASTACYEARICSTSLYELHKHVVYNGALAVFSTKVSGLTFSSAGMNEHAASELDIDTFVGYAESINHHPKKIPDTKVIKVKLIFSKKNLELIGAQIMGPDNVGEMINIVALAIQRRTSVYELENFQIATHPLLTSPPTNYPLIQAALNAASKLTKKL